MGSEQNRTEQNRTEMRALAKSKSSGSTTSSVFCYEGQPVKRLKTEVVLRLLASVIGLLALVVIVTDKQVKRIAFLPGFLIYKEAKYNGVKIFVLCVSLLGIVAGYSLIQTVRCLVDLHRESASLSTNLAWCTFFLDQVMAYLLLSVSAGGAETSHIATRGNVHFGWLRTCNLFGRFCNQVGAGIMLSFVVTVIVAITSGFSAFLLFSSTG